MILILAILATIASIAGTLLVMFANGMSDAPTAPFQGIGLIITAWVITASLWLAWGLG